MKSRFLLSIFLQFRLFSLRILTVLFFITAGAATSYADTHTWVPSAGGVWTAAANWLPATAPVGGDDIIISTDQTADITGVPALSINSMTISGNCVLVGTGGGTTLTIGGAAGTDLFVNAGKTLTIGANLNIALAGNSTSLIDGTLLVSAGRNCNINGAGVVTTVNGTIAAFGTVTCTTATKLLFQTGSSYNHALNGGIIPTGTWGDGSTCNITGVVANQPDAVSMGQSFYNLIWNNAGQTWNPTTGSLAAGADYKIRGTFTFINSGTGSNVWPSLNCTVANYVHTGGIDRLSYSNPRIHTIGSFSVSGGTVDFTQSTGAPIINISGNVSVSGGTLTVSGTGNATINFTGTGVQTFTSGGVFSGTQSWNILNGSTVNFGTSILSGTAASTFTLNAGGTIITANASGLSSTGATGSVQLGGPRTYTAGANYTYNGTTPQVTGNGLTGAANLTINNPLGITLSGNVPVSGTLNFIDGIITTGTNTLSMGLAASITGADMGTYVFGNLMWNIATGAQNKTFEIGDASRYTPVTVVINGVTTPGTLTGSSLGITHPNLASSPISTIKYIRRVYTLTNSGLVFGTANVSLNWALSDIQGFANYTKFMVALYNSGWTTPTFSGRTSNSIQATGLTSFGDLQVGESNCIAPAITIAPVNQVITYGADALFTITATGTGITYKWQEDRGSGFANITDGGVYSNSATATLNITKPAASMNGYKYRCVITGTCGTVTSNGNSVLTVNKKPLSITVVNKTKKYDGIVFPPAGYNVTYSGFITAENETALTGILAFTGSAVAAVNAGIYVITAGGLTSGNYDITFVDGTLEISKKALSVTAVNKTKVYDGAPFAAAGYTVSYNGFVTGEDETDLTGTVVYTGTSVSAVNSGSYVITPGNLTSLNYNITFIDGTLNITKRGLTVTADDKSKIYGSANPLLTVTYSGFISGENSSAITVPVVSTAAVTGSPSGTYPITLSGGSAANYSLSLVNGLLTVTKAELTAKAEDKTKIYGSVNPALTILYTGFVNGDNPSVISEPSISTSCLTGSSVGTYPITLAGGSSANYSISLVNGVLVVNKATALVTLGNLTATYDGTGKSATASTQPAGLTVVLTYNGSASAPVNAGTYPVTGTVVNINYLGSATGSLVINKAPQTISFSNIPLGLRMTQEHQLEATASSGLEVTIVSSNSDIVNVSGTTISIVKEGTVTLTASQEGNNNWLPAENTVQTVVTLPTFDNITSLFTPNNDGMNDYWYIPGIEEYGKLQVTVYNRFGQAVYKSDSYMNDWDGTWNGNPLPSASYYYIMKSSVKGSIKGVVNIVR
jgi:gliding motility-associated-like protein